MDLSKYADNNGVMLHYFDSLEKADEKLIPLVVCQPIIFARKQFMEFKENLHK